MEKIVKCNSGQCGQYFMQTKKDMQCPFCHTEYVEVEEKTKKKKEVTKTQKESFKIWKK